MLPRLFPGLIVCSLALAQPTGAVRGTVVLDATSEPLHGTRVTLTPLGRTLDTDDAGRYEFQSVPPGTYDVIALSIGLSDEHQTIRVAAGETVTADFRLRISAVRETVTVTATGREESPLNLVHSVATMDQLQLTARAAPSLGDVLESEPAITKRSAGPGTSRPVIRGFDGDRVLILEDGIRTGSLSSQSGDHGEPIDVNKLERVEVVRGPATLLYGSNAIGGVVNAVSRHDIFHGHAREGARGFLSSVAASNNALGGGSGGFEFGRKMWEFWGSGGGQRSSEYQMPLGTVRNSQARMEQADAGLGRYGEKSLFSFNYGFTDSKYGIPVNPAEADPEVADLLMRRHAFRASFGWKDVGFLEDVQGRLNYTDYNHQELVDGTPETDFFNNQFIYRGVFNQKKKGALGGSFGLWGMRRNYKTLGAEAIAPPTVQNSFAAFALENLDFETVRVQFGGRLETNHYTPTGLRSRSFTGLSAGLGVSKRLWNDGAFVANYSHSYRAPSIEELYNNGPHPGNLTFEIGNPNLKRERNDGLDVSLRHHSARVRAEANYFYYRIRDFVYLAPTGEIVNGLIEADYFQQDSSFLGGEAKLDVALRPNLWLNLSADAVSAQLTAGSVSLPRIPPVRGRIGFDASYKGFNVRPEVVLANAQNNIFSTETRTAGYAVVNVTGTYTIAGAHQLHQFSVNVFNAGDVLYRNHLSFIKSFAPEIGRGVRVGYTMQFF
jgi:iron complex outermembrane receptor protein